MQRKSIRTLLLISCLGIISGLSFGQSTEFVYQANLKDGAAVANANYDFEFALFDSLSGGTQQGSTLTRSAVAVTAGSFVVNLDFGSQFPGAGRFLEIHVRPAGSGAFTVLAPRQPISNTPYSMRSLNSAVADTATNATNAATASNSLQLGGLAAGQYVITTDLRLSDSRTPTAGSSNYIQNTASQQASSNFNVSGNGTVGGTLNAGAVSAGSVNTSLQYNIGTLRAFTIFDSQGLNTNTFVGVLAGAQASTGRFNSFFGCGAGQSTTTADGNSSFGCGAGGLNTLGANNTFLGRVAGQLTSTGSDNTFVGRNAGITNTTGSNNTVIGSGASVASNNLNFATAIGAGAVVSNDNTVVIGRNSDTIQIPGTAVLTNATFPNSNRALLAILRWDLVSRKTFGTGSSPQAVAFDGTNIWVVNNVSNNVTKLRASDGTNLGNFAVGTSPRAIAFDGSNIWVANESSNTVTKLRTSDGANLGNFVTGSGPRGVAFDGANIWVVNQFSDNVTKLRATDGANLGTFAVGTSPQKLAFDGTNIWVANLNSNNITKLQASNGANLGTFTLTAGPEAIAFDGENIWVAHGLGTTKLRPSDGADLGTINFANGGAVAFDGTHLWNVNLFGAIGRIRVSDGVLVNTFTFGSSPRGAAFDGANIWIASSESNTITKFPVFP